MAVSGDLPKKRNFPFGLEGMELPHSSEAEQAVLGSILLDPECMEQVVLMLRPEHFYFPQHRAIFTTMHSMFNLSMKIDPVIVLENLVKDGTYDEAGGKTYLLQLADMVPSTANVDVYAKIVREKYYIRTLITASQEIIDSAIDGQGDANLLLDSAEQRIYNIRQGKDVGGPSPIKEVIVNDVYGRLQMLNSDERDKYKGIPMGLSAVDKVTTGLNRSDLILIGARPGMGKTSFALNICENVAKLARKKVVFFSLEMTKEQLAQRMLSSSAGIPSIKMRTGQLDTDEWSRLGSAAAILSECQIYFDDTSNITVPEMKARVRRLKNVDVVIIDYLQLMTSGKRNESRVQEVSEITRSLKLMAKDLAIPVITLAQLSRSTEARGKSHRPQLADLRESGSIEQDADIVMMLYREDYYKNDSEATPDQVDINAAELIIAKNRHGSTDTIKLHWEPQFTRFTTVEEGYHGD